MIEHVTCESCKELLARANEMERVLWVARKELVDSQKRRQEIIERIDRILLTF